VKVLRLSREGRASWGAVRTLLLISQYREHEKLFRNVNYKTEEKRLGADNGRKS